MRTKGTENGGGPKAGKSDPSSPIMDEAGPRFGGWPLGGFDPYELLKSWKVLWKVGKLSTPRSSREDYLDPCGVCCLILIILGAIAWAYSVSPLLTAISLGIIGLIILILVGRWIARRERDRIVERPPTPATRTAPRPKPQGRTHPEAVSCVSCGFSFPAELDICPECGEERARCSVCQLDIVFGDDLVRCPYCGVPSHRDHLLEWIKIKGFCPTCRKELSAETLSGQN